MVDSIEIEHAVIDRITTDEVVIATSPTILVNLGPVVRAVLAVLAEHNFVDLETPEDARAANDYEGT